MASITLTVTGTTVGTITSTLTLSADDSDRLLAFLAANYGGDGVTPQQMIENYWAGMADGTLANVVRWEREQAAKTARDAVTPISVTQS